MAEHARLMNLICPMIKTLLDLKPFSGVSDQWKRVTVTFKPNDTAPHASLLTQQFHERHAGQRQSSFWIRNVSLMPTQTFKKHANGLRVDLAQHVNELKPAFVRFPGGCYVEGNVLANRFNWKNTLGDPMQRPGHLNDNWNYRSTDGLGYHEYLQWCEDMKSTPLFVVNCGMSHKQFVPIDELGPWVQDALDAIEYANGPVTSKWGALRAKNGHPAPFKLKYIEIGNENGLFGANFGGSREQYAERYKIFFDAIKTHYPDIVTIANTRVPHPMELVDDHYYNSPAWFWANVGLYDKYNRSEPKVYVGEYAVTSDCGTGNLKAALAEAAWMTGLERNGDVIKMTSYAPLFVNANDRKWNPDAIVFDSARSYGTPSYYVQKLYSLNRPDTAFRVDVPNVMSEPNIGKGGIGLDTWLTQAEFKDITVTQGDKTVYASDFAQGASDWKPVRGDWKVVDGAYRQAGEGTDRRSVLGRPATERLAGLHAPPESPEIRRRGRFHCHVPRDGREQLLVEHRRLAEPRTRHRKERERGAHRHGQPRPRPHRDRQMVRHTGRGGGQSRPLLSRRQTRVQLRGQGLADPRRHCGTRRQDRRSDREGGEWRGHGSPAANQPGRHRQRAAHRAGHGNGRRQPGSREQPRAAHPYRSCHHDADGRCAAFRVQCAAALGVYSETENALNTRRLTWQSLKSAKKKWKADRSALANHAAAVYSLQTDGFVVLKDVIDTAHLDVLRDKMLADLDTILQRPDAPFNFNTGNVQQDPPPFPPYLFRDVLVNDIVIAVTKSILGPNLKNSFYSGNTALPGGTRQPVHPDVAQLWPDLPTATPAFGLVVNVPVVDMDERERQHGNLAGNAPGHHVQHPSGFGAHCGGRAGTPPRH